MFTSFNQPFKTGFFRLKYLHYCLSEIRAQGYSGTPTEHVRETAVEAWLGKQAHHVLCHAKRASRATYRRIASETQPSIGLHKSQSQRQSYFLGKLEKAHTTGGNFTNLWAATNQNLVWHTPEPRINDGQQ